ncbi:MAG: hypothetical protein V1799_03040 [bacterium]
MMKSRRTADSTDSTDCSDYTNSDGDTHTTGGKKETIDAVHISISVWTTCDGTRGVSTVLVLKPLDR